MHRSIASIDHPVSSSEQQPRDSKVERLRGIHVDNQLDLG
jgi:hypothetical protein